MNETRRNMLAKAEAMLAEAAAIVRQAADEESEYAEAMPDNMQSSERHEKAEAAADKLSELADYLEGDASEAITEACE